MSINLYLSGKILRRETLTSMFVFLSPEQFIISNLALVFKWILFQDVLYARAAPSAVPHTAYLTLSPTRNCCYGAQWHLMPGMGPDPSPYISSWEPLPVAGLDHPHHTRSAHNCVAPTPDNRLVNNTHQSGMLANSAVAGCVGVQ